MDEKSFPRKRDSLARARLEDAEGWDDAIPLAPKLKFPSDWEVQIIPPFCGALMRFIAHKGGKSVSVYADYNEALGFYGEPHWEIYPDVDDENVRFALADTEEMLAAVDASLTANN